MDLDFGRAEAKAAAGVGFRDRRRTRRRRRRRRKKGGGTRWPLRMACKTSKLTDSQPGSDMQSRQQEQIAAVGGCHSCPIWQAVKNRRGGKTGGNRYGPWCTARKTRKPETGCSVITQSIGLLSEFSNIAAFQCMNRACLDVDEVSIGRLQTVTEDEGRGASFDIYFCVRVFWPLGHFFDYKYQTSSYGVFLSLPGCPHISPGFEASWWRVLSYFPCSPCPLIKRMQATKPKDQGHG
uniref:HDC07103 n=1 Tax=Drosophila melanogaster TaxID=7227 RepID=Q6IG73_DROME|nr:TPA_inf: HDC07103 [Drosophila melanogaster]